jgi:hypothetical protein
MYYRTWQRKLKAIQDENVMVKTCDKKNNYKALSLSVSTSGTLLSASFLFINLFLPAIFLL